VFQSTDPSAAVPGQISDNDSLVKLIRRYCWILLALPHSLLVQILETSVQMLDSSTVANNFYSEFQSNCEEMTIPSDGPLLARCGSNSSVWFFNYEGTV